MILTLPSIEGDNILHLAILKAICGPTQGKSMIDLCCYHAPTTPKLGFLQRTYVDIQDRYLDDPNEHQYFVCANVLEIQMHFHGLFDVALCLDGIEHFTKADGMKLLSKMDEISHKQILFTPLGSYNVQPETSHPDTHKSGWEPPMAGYANIILPNFHPTLGYGAFYFFKCHNLEQEFERVKQELSWIK